VKPGERLFVVGRPVVCENGVVRTGDYPQAQKSVALCEEMLAKCETAEQREYWTGMLEAARRMLQGYGD